MKLTWETFTIKAKHPFKISRAVKQSVDRVWVRVAADGLEGWGEAAPSRYYGETAGTVVAALERMRTVIEDAEDPGKLETLERELRGAIGHNGSAHAAVSAALHDLVGKDAGLPLWKLWGLDPAEAPLSSFTIGLDEPDVVRQKVLEAAEYPILKVKLGTDRDEEILSTICDAASPETVLRVDANAAWTARQAVERIEMLAAYGVEFVEQPLDPADHEGFRFLHGRSALPIIADESCIDSAGVPGLVGLVDGINIKLAKCGGPREALRMIHSARASGLLVMMGCMLESSLGIAPAAHLASLLDYADLDGAALLAEDPFVGPGLVGPAIQAGDAPGLGVTKA